MLRKLRIVLAFLALSAFILLFCDFTGLLTVYLNWLAKGQLWPAILAENVIILLLIFMVTIFIGRAYCSVWCPLGIYMDIFNRLAAVFWKKNRFSYQPAKWVARYIIAALAILVTWVGFMPVVALVDPYSIFGKIAANLLAPAYQGGNNLLAGLCAHYNSYAFYPVEIRYLGLSSLLTAIVFACGMGILAWFKGRWWCAHVCPVGLVLGTVARFAKFQLLIDYEKCNHCGLCAKRCRTGCINSETAIIDHSRCVLCFDCMENCKQGAISFRRWKNVLVPVPKFSKGRRSFLSGSALLLATAGTLKAQNMVDGGLAPLKPRNKPNRGTEILPPGAQSAANLAAKCSGCQLCASVCKTGIIKGHCGPDGLWQPRLDFSNNYCRPECTRCGEVCPTGAIRPLTVGEKSSRQIGRAVWIRENCLGNNGVTCTACSRHCPSGAIILQNKMPIIDPARCIGCGACEYYCPARPDGAIYIAGLEQQHSL